MLKFDNICLMLDNKLLLNHCSGQVQQGEKIILTGFSGSGKSLLLKILSSLVAPTSGTITLNGKKLSEISPKNWRSNIGFIQQQPMLIDGTVLENLQLPFSFHFYKKQIFNEQWHIQQLATLGKNADFLQQNSQHLSGGERQFVNLLRCLQLNPTYLLLDEPTSALDSISKESFENLLFNWLNGNNQRACVWISHDNEQVEKILAIGGKSWRMEQGKLLC